RDGGRPAGDASQECCPEPAQVLLIDEPRLPFWSRTARLERLAERPEADHELVVVAQEFRDVDTMRHEHVARRKDLRAVQPHFGQRREAVETQEVFRGQTTRTRGL